MTTNPEHRYLMVDADMRSVGIVDDERLSALTERHRLELTVAPSEPAASPLEAVVRGALKGMLLRLDRGLPSNAQIRFLATALSRGVRVIVYWPREQALEVVDDERLRSYRWHLRATSLLIVMRRVYRAWAVIRRVARLPISAMQLRGSYRRLQGSFLRLLEGSFRRLRGIFRRLGRIKSVFIPMVRVARGRPVQWAFGSPRDEAERRVKAVLSKVAPLPLSHPEVSSDGRVTIEGCGAYLRLDFWAPITSGGSYGHTCYVAKNLALSSDSLVCFMAQRYDLLDEMGLRQVVLPCADTDGHEFNLIAAGERYYQNLRAALEVLQPSYIYERICLGNWTGAALSQDLQIPYIVEYNGSEISMSRSFGGSQLEFEDVFELIERAAFSQASVISVVSEPIRDTLVRLGISPHKILINPNGADPEAYAPPTPEAKLALRASLGFGPDDCVVGFTGTFGGWHGIDVLADAVPRICQATPKARFLFIGDGHYKHLVDDTIRSNGLDERCVSVGRVPQAEGARLLGACDVYVSPHNAHMVDSRFFGSPTKLFEYMSMAGGIVASDLEQIGEVLRPALTPDDLDGCTKIRNGARAILCRPGDLEGFVRAVVCLVNNPELSRVLGANARAAVLENYTWERHVEKLWRFAKDAKLCTAQLSVPLGKVDDARILEVPLISTGDAYKDEVQQQWNVDACGSHYISGVPARTLEWYLEAERYRYREYAPWMHETMEFAMHAEEDVLEVGAGLGTDLAQFALHGARTTDLDLSGGHLAHAQENFRLRGLRGQFVHQDAESMPFEDASFDVVYSNGVIHHTPNTAQVIDEIWRVLRPGGKAIVMVYAENSLHYWRNLFFQIGFRQRLIEQMSMGEIMSRNVELSTSDQRPLVKVYTPARLRRMFSRFAEVEILQRQLTRAELPSGLRWCAPEVLGRCVGWNHVVKARKP